MQPSTPTATLLHSETLSRAERCASGASLRVHELKGLARELAITGYSGLHKAALIERLVDAIDKARQIQGHWRARPGSMAFDEAWELAYQLAKLVAPEFDARPDDDVVWPKHSAGAYGASRTRVQHGDYGWTLSKASWGEGPAETRDVEAWTFVPQGLREGIVLTLTVKREGHVSSSDRGVDLSLDVVAQPRDAETVERLRAHFAGAVM